MDPATFTQKLLERTQARKEALRKKNEEFNACRNKRVAPPTPSSPAKPPRRPLTEDNSACTSPSKPPRKILCNDNKESFTQSKRRPMSEDNSEGGLPDEAARRRIVSDSSVPKTPTKVTVTARVPTTPKSTSAKLPYSDRAPPTPTSVSKVRAGLEVDASSSPSIRARKEQLIIMQQKDQESSITPKKHWKKALDMTETKSPSVAARSAIFENNKEKGPVQTTQSTATPSKISAKRGVFEKQDSTEAKPVSSAPPKPPRTTIEEKTLHREKSSSKRKAPPPPTDVTDGPARKTSAEEVSCDYSVVSARKSSEEVPSKRERKTEREVAPQKTVKTTVEVVMEPVAKPRKRTQHEDEKEKIKKDINDLEEERARRREERKKARMEMREREEVLVAKAQGVEDNRAARSRHVEAVAVHVTEVSSPQKTAPRPKARVEVVIDKSSANKDKFDSNKKNKTKLECEPVLPSSAQTTEPEKPVLPSSAQITEPEKPAIQKETKKAKLPVEDRQEFVPMAKHGSASHLRSTDNLHRYGSLGDMYAGADGALDETINLNDVNIHEMTFTFDFSNFDKIQEDRETKFQKSFNETQQELEKEKSKEPKSIEIEKVKMIAHQPRPTATVEEKNNGVFKSGYSMDADDKYATKVYKKERPPVPERPKPTQEKIKDILDQAASHQNIILQTSQALNVCESNNDIFKGSQEEIEAERVLLLASERKQACLNEHHRLKSGRKESKRNHHIDPKACSSTVSLSGIRLALKQEFMDVLRVGIRHDLGVFHFVCHVQHGPLEITTTKALSIHDCTGDGGNFLTFPDKFVMKNLNPDFNIVVRVFGMHVHKYNPYAANTAQKHKFFQSPKTAKNKRGVPDGSSPRGAEAMPVFRTSNFKLVGSTRITLPKVNSKKWVLDGLVEGCPLKETIQMKIQCMPQYTSCVKGFLTILEDVGGYSAWQRRWCVLEGGMLSYWRYPGDEADKAPLGTLDIGQCISERIATVPRDLCARPNTIEVAMKKDDDEEYKFLLACDTKEDRITWLDCLNDALTDMKAWNSNNKKVMYPEISHSADEKVHMC